MPHTHIDFFEATHVIIRTRYSPHLYQLLEIESVLSQQLNRDVTCVFASDYEKHLGILIPDPYGFMTPSISFDDLFTPKDYISRINSIMEQNKNTVPFYDHCMNCLHDKLMLNKTQDFHTYEDILRLVSETTLIPCARDLSMDFESFNNMVEERELCDMEFKPYDSIYNAMCEHEFIIESDMTPLLSYADRLEETKKIVNLYGGPENVNGLLCLKINGEQYSNLTSIMTIIENNGLSYCDYDYIRGIDYRQYNDMNILELDYSL